MYPWRSPLTLAVQFGIILHEVKAGYGAWSGSEGALCTQSSRHFRNHLREDRSPARPTLIVQPPLSMTTV